MLNQHAAVDHGGGTVARQQGSRRFNGQIATVSDPDQPAILECDGNAA